jgi:hypothetical protein
VSAADVTEDNIVHILDGEEEARAAPGKKRKLILKCGMTLMRKLYLCTGTHHRDLHVAAKMKNQASAMM